MLDSGGFPTFPFGISISVSPTLADSVAMRDHIVLVSYQILFTLIVVFLSLARYESIILARSLAPILK